MRLFFVMSALVLAVAVSASDRATVPADSELVIDHSAYPAGTYHLVLVKSEDGSVSLSRANRVVVDLDGRPVTDSTPPADPGDPADPDEPTLMDLVRGNFEDEAEFERQRTGLVLALEVSPGLSAAEANQQIQQWMAFVLGDTAERWQPWLEWFKKPIASGDVSDLDAFTDWIDQARESLQ